ncbi:MAG: HAD-IIB family hydrolase [Gammaproteobacteria bacterium]|nr:MAG: HAD-IIB family hydrolase [Gammaproteobacteria bacterium]
MNNARVLLCTDLDRTLIPNGNQPESPQARQRFKNFVSHDQVTLAYVTGRHRALIEKAIRNYQLPTPDFVISDVGTNIYDLRKGQWETWQRWQDEIAPDWAGYGHQQLVGLLAGINELRLQEYSKQNRFKVSYYHPLDLQVEDMDLAISVLLQENGIDASLVWSVDEPAGIGLLDIVPRHATKLHAVDFLRQYLQIPLKMTLFAGDSGNDLPVLASNIPSVLVANAAPAVARSAITAAKHTGNEESLYLAHGGFLEMNGNYSAGILEGIAHYHPGLVELIKPGQFSQQRDAL